jgi:hypothetical protein
MTFGRLASLVIPASSLPSGKSRTGFITVTVAGLFGYGTLAAGRFLTDPTYFEDYSRRAGFKPGNRNMQIVLATEVIHGRSGRPEWSPPPRGEECGRRPPDARITLHSVWAARMRRRISAFAPSDHRKYFPFLYQDNESSVYLG